jgi:hypothetical protein
MPITPDVTILGDDIGTFLISTPSFSMIQDVCSVMIYPGFRFQMRHSEIRPAISKIICGYGCKQRIINKYLLLI